jgi:ribokinase
VSPPIGAASVTVVGSINADVVVTVGRLPAPGETVTDGRLAYHGGGKGANQAVAAARAGARVAMVGAVGDDHLGGEALRVLAAEGIDVSAVSQLQREVTGLAAVVVHAGTGENQIAVASGANGSLSVGAVEDALGGSDGSGGVVLVGHEVPEAAVVAAARQARAAGCTVVLNPAPVRRLPDELLEAGPILTPNAIEACALSGASEESRAARLLAARTGAPVLVTLGADGVVMVEPDGNVEHFAAMPVEAVDTTGAGDAFNGALAAELAAGRPLRDAVRFAVAAASLSVRAPGARAGLPRRVDVLNALGGG